MLDTSSLLLAKASKEQRELVHNKQLLVEGKDAVNFFYPFIKAMDLSDIQIHDFGSVSNLAAFLGQFVISPNFKKLPVTSIAIVRDAELNAKSARQSVYAALEKARLPIPGKLPALNDHKCKVDVFILPDGENSGMIETLILRAVKEDPAFHCIDKYFECVIKSISDPQPREKARFLAFLASRPDIFPLMGHAAKAGYLKFDSDAYMPLKQFLLDTFT